MKNFIVTIITRILNKLGYYYRIESKDLYNLKLWTNYNENKPNDLEFGGYA